MRLYGDHHGEHDQHVDEHAEHGHFVGHEHDSDLFAHAFEARMFLVDKGHLFVVHRHPESEDKT